MGKSSQRKGREAERELAEILQAYGFPDVRPGEPLNYGTEPDLVGLHGVHIECKRSEKLHIPEWMAQAERDAERFQDGAPAVYHRRSRQPWLVTMHLSDWIPLYRAWSGVDKLAEALEKQEASIPLIGGTEAGTELAQKAAAEVAEILQQTVAELKGGR